MEISLYINTRKLERNQNFCFIDMYLTIKVKKNFGEAFEKVDTKKLIESV